MAHKGEKSNGSHYKKVGITLKKKKTPQKLKRDMLNDWDLFSAKEIKQKQKKNYVKIPIKKKHLGANLPYKNVTRKKGETRAQWKARIKSKDGKRVIEKSFKIYASKKLT